MSKQSFSARSLSVADAMEKKKQQRNEAATQGAVNESDEITPGKVKKGDAFDPMAVRWVENFEKPMDSLWNKVPGLLKPILVSVCVFTLGVTIRGKFDSTCELSSLSSS